MTPRQAGQHTEPRAVPADGCPEEPAGDPPPLPEQVIELVAQRFRILAEPARIRLLDALRSGPATVGALAARLGLSQQNTSKHLCVLAASGLVERTRAGSTAVYTISDPSVFTLCEVVCDSLRHRAVVLQSVLPSSPDRRTGAEAPTGP